MNLELLRVVGGDIDHLDEEVQRLAKMPEDKDGLRRLSGSLRRLLVDGLVGKAWRELGKQREPKIGGLELTPVASNSFVKELVGRRVAVLVAAIDIEVKDYKWASPVLFAQESATSDGDKRVLELYEQIFATSEPIGLTPYLEKPVFFVNGVQVRRREVIKYIANKLGGVHYDPKIEAKEKSFRVLENFDFYSTMEKTNPGKVPIHITGDLNLLNAAVLSIAQQVVGASEISELRREVKRALS